MDYKELIKTQLELLKKMGKSRRDIENDLKYAPLYIDQAISKGGNEKLYNAIVLYKDSIEDQQGVFSEADPEYVTKNQLIESMKQTIKAQNALIAQLQDKIAELEANSSRNGKRQRSA